jgi:hypothetical protein
MHVLTKEDVENIKFDIVKFTLVSSGTPNPRKRLYLRVKLFEHGDDNKIRFVVEVYDEYKDQIFETLEEAVEAYNKIKI